MILSHGGVWAPATSPTAVAVDGSIYPTNYIADTVMPDVDLALSEPGWQISEALARDVDGAREVAVSVNRSVTPVRVEFPGAMCADLLVKGVGEDYTAEYVVRLGVSGASCPGPIST